MMSNDEVNEKQPAACLSKGSPLIAFVGLFRDPPDLIGRART